MQAAIAGKERWRTARVEGEVSCIAVIGIERRPAARVAEPVGQQYRGSR